MMKFSGWVLAGVVPALLVLAGCVNENTSGRAPQVSVTLFKATPASIPSGGGTTLEWATQNASSCEASGTLPGWSGAKGANGTLPLIVADAGTYEARLTCLDTNGGSDTEAITVTVSAAIIRIDSFTATPATVAKDGTTTIEWTTSNASSCVAEGSLPGWSGAKATSGSEVLTLETVGNYQARLVCSDGGTGTATESLAVSVTEVLPDVTIDLFSADPSELLKGASTQLSWASTDATGCVAGGTLPGWSGNVAVSGTQLVPVATEGEYTATLTCGNGGGTDAMASITITVTLPKRVRYSMANKCFAIKAAANNKYVVATGTGNGATYAATGTNITGATPFYMKPSALGEYLLYHGNPESLGNLVTAAIAASNPEGAVCTPGQTLCNATLANAIDSSIFEVKGAGDATVYPAAPEYDSETYGTALPPASPPRLTGAHVQTWRNFVDPNTPYSHFTFVSKPDTAGRRLTANATSGAVSLAAPVNPAPETQQFIFEEGLTTCAPFPEAQSSAVGNTFKGTTADGRVVGFADTHVHVTSTTFLGGAKAGAPFHKFGVTHAVGDCSATHGPQGSNDFLSAAYQGDDDGHATDGWPTFTDWPHRAALSDEAMYWKWIERAWLGGQRVLVNDLVDNGTLCELQRNAVGPGDPRSTSENCNEMQTAREQASTTYAMQDYIDAQYGGRGKGFWQVVWSPAEARQVIADGKMAVIMGIELTNMFDCQLVYNPARAKEPFEEPTDATPAGTENHYKCKATETGAPNEIKTQLDDMYGLGLRQIISVHEFDIAFGGNGIFNAVILNLGNRENSGGNPTPGVPPNNPFDPPEPPAGETPTGEFWTTYDCPVEPGLWGGIGQIMNESAAFAGTPQEGQPFPTGCAPPGVPGPPGGPYSGQGGRPGGSVACYPAAVPQCNARLMTPIGLYLYKLVMEKGLILDFDHMAFEMKNQILTLAERQDPPYPTVSTHGTFGGTSLAQARRVLKAGGHLYPSLGRSTDFINDMVETKALWAETDVAASEYRIDLFGFGFGTDTNGLSGQSDPRRSQDITADGPVIYPFTTFKGPVFDAIPEFATLDDDGDPATPYAGVTFKQPEEFDLAGESARKWHADVDGTAHAGMVTDNLYELQIRAIASAQRDSVPVAQRVEHVRDLFNSAEVFLQTWEKTLASRDGILANDNGGKAKGGAGEILYEAPGKWTPPFP